MLSWIRRFPHDAIHRRSSSKSGGGAGAGGSSNAGSRRTSSSTSWRNRSFTARVIRCASTIVFDPTGRQRIDEEEEEAGSSSQDDADGRRPAPAPSPRNNVISARALPFAELATATGNFSPDNLLGEGGFGRVYRARLLLPPAPAPETTAAETTMEVAVKQLDRSGSQGNREFVVEVLMLSLLTHPNLVGLVGYCADGEQRLLVYPLMPRGSLEDHLLRRRSHAPLPWRTRMRIAHGAARGLEYLHDRAVIYRDLKSSNILLDADFTPRLSDFGLARLLPAPRNHSSSSSSSSYSSSSSSSSSSSRVMGTYGYCAPEYLRTGQLCAKSDVYSFGVVLLELIAGRRVIDCSRPDGEQSLVAWAAPMFGQPKRFHELADPRLVMAMQAPPPAELNQAVGVATMCLQEHHALRPVMADVVVALSYLATASS